MAKNPSKLTNTVKFFCKMTAGSIGIFMLSTTPVLAYDFVTPVVAFLSLWAVITWLSFKTAALFLEKHFNWPWWVFPLLSIAVASSVTQLPDISEDLFYVVLIHLQIGYITCSLFLLIAYKKLIYFERYFKGAFIFIFIGYFTFVPQIFVLPTTIPESILDNHVYRTSLDEAELRSHQIPGVNGPLFIPKAYLERPFRVQSVIETDDTFLRMDVALPSLRPLRYVNEKLGNPDKERGLSLSLVIRPSNFVGIEHAGTQRLMKWLGEHASKPEKKSLPFADKTRLLRLDVEDRKYSKTKVFIPDDDKRSIAFVCTHDSQCQRRALTKRFSAFQYRLPYENIENWLEIERSARTLLHSMGSRSEKLRI